MNNNGLITNVIVVDGSIPEGYEAYEGSPIIGVTVENSHLASEALQAKENAEMFLTDTDWVVIKINEASLAGDDIEPLKMKYADILSSRADARVIINEAEVAFNTIMENN